MPKGPQAQRRPADTVANAVRVAKILTGEVEENTGDLAPSLSPRAGRGRCYRDTSWRTVSEATVGAILPRLGVIRGDRCELCYVL